MAVMAWFGLLNQSLLLLATFQLGVAAAVHDSGVAGAHSGKSSAARSLPRRSH
jgi:hypothetical protein